MVLNLNKTTPPDEEENKNAKYSVIEDEKLEVASTQEIGDVVEVVEPNELKQEPEVGKCRRRHRR